MIAHNLRPRRTLKLRVGQRSQPVRLFLHMLLLAAPLVWIPAVGSAQEEQSDGAPLELIHGFTLIDGTGRAPVPDAALAIRGHMIMAVGTRAELQAQWANEPNLISVDLGGGYVTPGLIDAHVHLATAPNRPQAEVELKRMLYAGITTVRDMAVDGRALASLARDSRLGEITSPDIYYSALMAGPSFLADPRPQASAVGVEPGTAPWMQPISPETDMVEAVARAKGTYAQGIKIYANLPPAEVNRIADEAHRQGMPVWAHSMVFPTRPLEVVRAGADVVSHVCRLAWEAMADAPSEYHHQRRPDFDKMTTDAPVFTEIFEEMKARGTILDATLALYGVLGAAREARAASTQGEQTGPPAECDTDFARALVRRANAMGVSIAAGTDFGTDRNDPFPALNLELEELVAFGGLTPADAIRSATSVAARAIGIDQSVGTLEAGKDVNFVLLDRDPTADIKNLRSVREVWKHAARFHRGDFRNPGSVMARPGGAGAFDTSTPEALLDSWIALWASYDLDRVGELFLNDERLTYFSSEYEGVIEGFPAIIEHHAGFGFVSGGVAPTSELWVDGAEIREFGETAIVGGVWYFGDRADPAAAGRGAMTIVLLRTPDGYRIFHMHFGNYEPGLDS